MRELLTCKEVAQKLGYSISYIRRLCARQAIKSKKFGTDWLIHHSSINHIKPKSKKDDVNG